jgi:hypothetical protein
MREPIDYGMTLVNDYGSVLDVLMRYSENLEGSGFCDSEILRFRSDFAIQINMSGALLPFGWVGY